VPMGMPPSPRRRPFGDALRHTGFERHLERRGCSRSAPRLWLHSFPDSICIERLPVRELQRHVPGLKTFLLSQPFKHCLKGDLSREASDVTVSATLASLQLVASASASWRTHFVASWRYVEAIRVQ
jgi:hypothetical protein